MCLSETFKKEQAVFDFGCMQPERKCYGYAGCCVLLAVMSVSARSEVLGILSTKKTVTKMSAQYTFFVFQLPSFWP